MEVAYSLKRDLQHIADVQRATLTTPNFGIEVSCGLFGSEEWWMALESGRLPLRKLKGTISRVFMGSMGDWPSFEVLADDGSRSTWTREANSRGQLDLYKVGHRIEVDFVSQRSRSPSPEFGTAIDIVVEIRIQAEDRKT